MAQRTLLFVALVRSVCAAQVNDPAVLNNLGSLHYSAERYSDAEKPLTRAIEIWSGDPSARAQLATALHNLGAVYRAEGRFAEARPLYEKALKVREELTGGDDPSLLPVLDNLALLYSDLADYNRAHETAARAASIVESHGAADTALGAASYRTLGVILEAQGKTVDAKVSLRRALATYERVLEPNNPVIAGTLCDLALVYRHESQWKEATALYRRALTLYQATPGSHQTPGVRNDLAQTLAAAGQKTEAELEFRRAVAESIKQSGPDHPDVAAELTGLAELFGSRHKFDEAERLLQRAREIDLRNFPPEHIKIAQDLTHAADLAFERKQYERAESLLDQAGAILRKNLTPNHPEIGKVTASLADIRQRQGRLDESEDLYRRAVSILEQAWGPESPRLLLILDRYSLVLRAHRDYSEAEGVATRAMKIRVTQTLRSSD